jgi:hypothetical protein
MPVLAVQTPQPLRDPSGTVAAYFVPASEFEALLSEMSELRQEVARLTRQRDGYVARLTDAYQTLQPPPLSDEELDAPVQNPNGLDEILAKLEAE